MKKMRGRLSGRVMIFRTGIRTSFNTLKRVSLALQESECPNGPQLDRPSEHPMTLNRRPSPCVREAEVTPQIGGGQSQHRGVHGGRVGGRGLSGSVGFEKRDVLSTYAHLPYCINSTSFFTSPKRPVRSSGMGFIMI